MLYVHRALLALTAALWGLSVFYAIRALTGRPHRARRATRWAAAGTVAFFADTLGVAPIWMHGAESTGSAARVAWTLAHIVGFRGIPLVLWGAALFGRWRGWLADKVMAFAVIIAAAVTLVLYVIRIGLVT